jgi:hypothetical protein
VVAPKGTELMALLKSSRLSCLLLPLVFSSSHLLATTASAQDVLKEPFLAEHYDVTATLDPASQG